MKSSSAQEPEQSAPDNAESVTMPSVLHIPQERVETILAELGLKVEIQMGQSEIESGGNVMVQEPAQNTVLQKGRYGTVDDLRTAAAADHRAARGQSA